MRLKWGQKEFTLLIIPGANRRTVRIKLPHSSLYTLPSIVFLVLIGFVVTLYVMDARFKQTTSSMQQAHAGQERALAEQIEHKNAELAALQTDLIELSEQTNDFKAKLEEIRKLEHVIELMTEEETSRTPSGKTSVSNERNEGYAELHVGGEEIPVAAEDVTELAHNTKEEMGGLVHDIGDMLVSLTESEAQLTEAKRIRDLTPTIWPTSTRSITSRFGMRLDPFTQAPSMHAGLDIDGETGDPVYAAAAGKVAVASWDASHGNHIVINHTRGLETAYMHMSKLLVKVGENVTKGQQIGLVGSTGRSTGSHLHYEVHRNKVPIDPKPYLLTDRKED